MNTILAIIFCVTYAAIAFEYPIKINKSASALLGAGLLWTVFAVMSGEGSVTNEHLAETLVGTAQIVFFLLLYAFCIIYSFSSQSASASCHN